MVSLFTLALTLLLAYELFLCPMPDEETLQEEGLTEDDIARTSTFNIALCIIAIIVVNVVNLLIF